MGREVFDDCVSIEEIIGFLQARSDQESLVPELVSRLEARIGLLEALCGKRSGTTWSPITLPEKRAFSDLYVQSAKSLIPTLTVRASSDGPKAITKFFDGVKLPEHFPSVRIKHEFGSKVATKYANLQFDGRAEAENALARSGLLDGSGFSLEVSGKALFVRKPTPGIDPTVAFEPQREKVLEGLYAIRDLTVWLEEKADSLLKVLGARTALATSSTSPGAGDDANEEIELREALLEIYRKCNALGYRPTGMLDLMSEYGAIGAVKRLIANPISDGFVKLALLGRLDLAVESLALQERWSGPFNDAELAVCRKRLR
jgi:hypothetical protein